MGFSVSGSAAIVFVGLFVAFGTFHAATTNGFERVTDARESAADQSLRTENTAVEITAAEWNTTSNSLNVSVRNDGSTTLSVPDVDLLADNTYLTDYETTVDGDASTELWLPGETLELVSTAVDANPGRVKVVTGPGVAATSATTEVS